MVERDAAYSTFWRAWQLLRSGGGRQRHAGRTRWSAPYQRMGGLDPWAVLFTPRMLLVIMHDV